jgi:alkyldihydroxyacetonephosphate synthase
VTQPTMPNELPEGELRTRFAGAELSAQVLEELRASGVTCVTDLRERYEHGRDWWPLSLGWLAEGQVPALPGVVVMATSVDDVVRTVNIARKHGVGVTPQGGRSGVVGGAIAPTGTIALDLTGLNQVLEVDEVSATVRVQAGCFGPELESHVRERGFTVGHFPQSFDLATVGGWLACRGAGQYSNRYGKIEEIVRSLTVVLADGRTIVTGGRGPRQAVGPDLNQLFVGAEGAFGVIVEATLVLRRVASFESRSAYSFDSFADGLDACRRILQRGARPAVLRLYDEAESKRNFDIERCALIVLDEGDRALVDATMGIVREECASSTSEDEALVERWLAHRNDVGALATLWGRGIVVDTIEVAGPWSALDEIHRRVTTGLRALGDTALASVHQSHAYDDGACLYFTFVGRPATDFEGYYRQAWNVASEATLAAGGALSHHHGVGRNRARFVRDALGSGYSLLEDLKSLLDKNSIMNPGVLGLGQEPW